MQGLICRNALARGMPLLRRFHLGNTYRCWYRRTSDKLSAQCLVGGRDSLRAMSTLRAIHTNAAALDAPTATSSTAKTPASIPNPNAPTFQEAITRLQQYWASVGCAMWLPHNTEVGAGTMNPATFLRVLGPEPWNVAYPEPSIRPDDSRYGDNPNRVQRHTQFQARHPLACCSVFHHLLVFLLRF